MAENDRGELNNLALLKEWLTYLRESKGRSPATLRLYRRIMFAFVEGCVRGRSFDSVTPEQIEGWLQRPRHGTRSNGQVASAGTQHRDAAPIRGFYVWMRARGLSANMSVTLVSTPTVRNVHPKPMPDDAWRDLWAQAKGADAVALGLAFFGGLRREELTFLRVEHVDVAGRRLVGFPRKGGGDDVLPIGTMLDVFERKLPRLGADRLWDLLDEHVLPRGGHDFVIGWHDLGRPQRRAPGQRVGGLDVGQLDPQNINHWMVRQCKAAGIAHYSPHTMRHATATNLLRAGVPLPMASRLMNHSSVQTTMRYMKTGGDELAEWLDAS